MNNKTFKLTLRCASRSILGPLLFLLFINDLALFLDYCSNTGMCKTYQNKIYINFDTTTCTTVGTSQNTRDIEQINLSLHGNHIDAIS